MPLRATVRSPRYGKWLREQRGQLTLEMVAEAVRPLVKGTGLKVDQSLLYKIESGRVPSWPILVSLCHVYAVPYDEAVVRLARTVEFAGSDDLLSTVVPTVDAGSTMHGTLRQTTGTYGKTSAGFIAKELRELSARVSASVEDINRLLGQQARPPAARRRRHGSQSGKNAPSRKRA